MTREEMLKCAKDGESNLYRVSKVRLDGKKVHVFASDLIIFDNDAHIFVEEGEDEFRKLEIEDALKFYAKEAEQLGMDEEDTFKYVRLYDLTGTHPEKYAEL